MKNILMFKLKSVCYDSYFYFCDSIATQLQRMGYHVEIFDGRRECLASLDRFEGTSYDAVIDFNSDLPKVLLEDGQYFLNSIQAPFYDIILDHPLYHHDMLKAPLKNYHVICLDRNHKKYIQENYPHIQSVHVLPMTGEAASADFSNTRAIPLLFTGSYTPSNEIRNAIYDCPHFMQGYMQGFIQEMLENPSITLEECAIKLAKDNELIQEEFPLHMQSFFLADSYLRAYRREQLISTIIKAGLPITLCGHGWDAFLTSQATASSTLCRHVQLLPSVSFKESFRLMNQAEITLNILPEFKDGSHDRIYSAMLNHSICVTDTSPLIQEQFISGEDLLIYQLDQLEQIPSQLEILLGDEDQKSYIAENGYQKAIAHHTWKARVTELVTILQL